MCDPVIVHYHIFKNAGTSVDFALQNTFGDTWAAFEGMHPHDILNVDRLRAFLERNPCLKAVSSHLARPPLPNDRCLPIVFVRHPVLRAKSVYEFVRADCSQPNHDIAASGTFSDYLRWALAGGRGGIVIRNYQVVHLSDASFRAESILDARAELDDYEQARSLLLSWPAFGVVEYFDKSAKLFESAYSKLIDGFSFPHVWLNRTKGSSGDAGRLVDENLLRIKDEVGSALFDEFCAENEHDLNLYEFCLSRFFELSGRLDASQKDLCC